MLIDPADEIGIAVIAVAGADRIFSPLAGMASAASFCFDSSLTHQTMRAGRQLADVGPNFINSQTASSCSFDTGVSR